MPPKVDKAKQKEKEKIAIDKTFGLKNKNKSKQVQKYIKSIHNNAHGAPKGGIEEQKRQEKEAKEKSMQKTALLNSLFNLGTDKKGRAFDPVAKKQAKQAEEEALAAGRKLKEELKKEIIEGIANTIRLTNPKGIRMSELGGHAIIQALKEKHADTFKTLSMLLFMKANDKIFWIDDPESGNPMVRCQEDVDAEVAPDERAIEEIIEERRAALPPGGTPVTFETFKAWKEKREAERLEKVEEERKEATKKSGGKGLTGLSGRDLFTYDASLFVDDDGAASADEYDERSEAADDEEDTRQAAEGDEEEEEDEDAEGEEGEREADGEADACEGSAGARGSCEGQEGEDKSFKFQPAARQAKGNDAAGGGAINEQLFLDGGDLPDDLDDLDDD